MKHIDMLDKYLETLGKYLDKDDIRELIFDGINSHEEKISERLLEFINSVIYNSDNLYNMIDRVLKDTIEDIVLNEEYKGKIERALKRVVAHELSNISINFDVNIDMNGKFLESDGELLE